MADSYTHKFDPTLSGLAVNTLIANAVSQTFAAWKCSSLGNKRAAQNCLRKADAYDFELEERWLAVNPPRARIHSDGSVVSIGTELAWLGFVGTRWDG